MKFKLTVLALLLCLLTVNAAAAADQDIIRLGVMRFTSKAEGVSDMQAEVITDIFTRTLANSKSIALIERERLDMIGREHSLNMSGLVDMGMAVEVGRLAGCQYMLLGAVTGLDEKVSGGGFGGIITGSKVAEATIDMRIVDVTTTEVVLSLVQKGSSSQQSSAFSISGITFAEADLSDTKARAVSDAVARLGHRIREELAGEFSQVLSVSGKSININLGATSGVQKGDLYLVYSDGAEVFDLDGTSLGREKYPIAVIKVQNVSSGFSTCEVVPSGGKADLVQREDKIEPVASKDAKELAGKFVTERPRRRAYDATAEQLFGGGAAAAVASVPEQPAPAQASEAPAPAQPSPVQASPAPAAPVQAGQSAENESTDPAKVIATYDLDTGNKNVRRVAHINARKLRGQKAYDAYAELAESYGGDYLAAYQAGEASLRLRGKDSKDNARAWFEKALAINPNYEPAKKSLDKLK